MDFEYDGAGTVPPRDVRITGIKVQPLADFRRARVNLVLTPFEKPPNLNVSISSNGRVLASSVIIETASPLLTFTMHITGGEPGGSYLLRATVSYEDLGDVYSAETVFQFSRADSGA